ncbi:apolipoprotein L2-like [Myotis daubentonii]|uniref:apolipoprotein L2-like n=1 Tax=Myotis daubentonii TaxID=98922 RepID=UPI0028735D6B|nr:apolipoprotein L2-like [Myotis daubentonii]
MTSEADEIFPEGKDFVDAIEYLMDPKDKEKLHCLLSDESWEKFVAAANVSRDEADALYADLHQLEALMAEEDEDMPSAEQLHGESFMKEFPQVKQDLEERIRKLYALADEVDEVHRDCTITQVAASSAGAVSGILTIIGLSLAPVTAGVSLVLSATGIGLGAAAAVTGVTASIVEASKDASTKAKASRLLSTGSDTEKLVGEVLSRSTPKIVSLASRCIQSLQGIVKNARAFKLAKANPRLAVKAMRFLRTGAVSARSGKQVQKAFGGTALALSKGARVLGAATAGVFLLMDVVDLVKESIHLHEGAKAESAEELRQQAQELERRMEELTCIHESLQEEEGGGRETLF